MSFDLYFCSPKPERINFAEVKAWSERHEWITRKDSQLLYSNPRTGVYFSFDFEAHAPQSPDDGPDLPAGYFDSGLSFNLNYNRPSYFGFEAMPIAEMLASTFSLGVVNPQEDSDGPGSVMVVESDALIQSWLRSNKQAIRVMMEEPNQHKPLIMGSEASLYLWRYARARHDLARTCGESVFVPSLFPVQKTGDVRAYRATVYAEGIPTIIPECEWIFLTGRKKGFLRMKKRDDAVAISFDTLRETLATCIKEFPCEGPEVQIVSPELAAKAGRLIRTVGRTLPRSEFEVIGMDSFVDIDPSESPD